jgi:hypothetical protein
MARFRRDRGADAALLGKAGGAVTPRNWATVLKLNDLSRHGAG